MKQLQKILFALLTISIALANQGGEENGRVFGTVLNGSRDNMPVPEQEVMLQKYVQGQKVESFQMHSVTNAAGQYSFDGLGTGENITYYPTTVFYDIEYGGRIVQLTTDILQQESEVVVFETTGLDTAITVSMHHVIIEPGMGNLNVREVLYFTNHSTYSFVGTDRLSGDKKKVLELETHPAATEVELGGDLMSCCAIRQENKIFDTMEFQPGTRSVVLSYIVPYQGDRITWEKSIYYPTDNFDVFLVDGMLNGFSVRGAPGNRNPISVDVGKPEPFQIHDRSFNRYQVKNLTAGDTVELAIVDLPKEPTQYKLWAPVILILIIFVVYIVNYKGGSYHYQN